MAAPKSKGNKKRAQVACDKCGALCQRRGWGRELQLAYSVCANGKYHATIAALFGSAKILRSTP